MKKILIIGAGSQQVPVIQAARELGITSIVIDRDPNAPGREWADKFFAVDTNDVDNAMDLARSEMVDGAVTIGTDRPVLTVASLNDTLGFSGITRAMASLATHKGLMRDAFRNAGVRIPRYRRIAPEADFKDKIKKALLHVGLPAILKPTQLSGSRGVFKISTMEQLEQAIAHTYGVCGIDAEVIVEEFIDGREVSVETVSFAGHHYVLAITDKRTSDGPYCVEVGHSQPSRFSPELQQKISECSRAALCALGLMNTAGHVEMMVTPSGELYLIEIAARLGGDFISTELVKLSCGVNLAEVAIQLALGINPQIEQKWKRAALIRYILPKQGTLIAMRGFDEAKQIPGVRRVEFNLSSGQTIPPLLSSSNRVGYVIAEGENIDEANEAALNAVRQIEFEIH